MFSLKGSQYADEIVPPCTKMRLANTALKMENGDRINVMIRENGGGVVDS
jgi:hypothetical protein